MGKERWEKKNRGPKDISPEERAARDLVKALKRVYESSEGLLNVPTNYSSASPKTIFEAIQRAHSPQENSD